MDVLSREVCDMFWLMNSHTQLQHSTSITQAWWRCNPRLEQVCLDLFLRELHMQTRAQGLSLRRVAAGLVYAFKSSNSASSHVSCNRKVRSVLGTGQDESGSIMRHFCSHWLRVSQVGATHIHLDTCVSILKPEYFAGYMIIMNAIISWVFVNSVTANPVLLFGVRFQEKWRRVGP